MAETRKFGALAGLRQNAIPTRDEPPAAEPAPDTGQRRGRPPGKRSNPEWKLYSHFLKKKTQREASALLRTWDDGRDLSDVLQELLEQWTTQHKS
ncbi:MAG: hypothetical protein JO110_27405 [Acetobacteraceae bacterium]|nr:hypothetical protein [Acetobacteraceae bacterium]